MYREVQDPLTAELFAVQCCTACGLGHTTPRPGDVGRYYTRQYYGKRHGFTLRHCLKRRLGFVEAALGKGAKGRLLDIGCGDGSFLAAARDKGWQVMGTELNPEPVRTLGFPVVSDVGMLPPYPPFACITMWHTLEHMTDIPRVLAKARQLLADDGRLIIAVPDLGGLQARLFRRHWLHLDVPRHLFHLNDRSLSACLAAAGFRVERRWHQELEYDLMGWSQSALNWLLPTPNLFFDLVTGKPSTAGPLQKTAALLLGGIFTLLALPAQVVGTFMGRGGTLVVVARPQSAAEAPAPQGATECSP
jgi:SAM-dependent methyltransferase